MPSGSNKLTPLALSRVFGVTSQTIAVWRRNGMPTAGRDAKGHVYDEAVCRAWRAQNVSTDRSGGVQPGAGRPPKGGKPKAPSVKAEAAKPEVPDIDPDVVDQPGATRADMERARTFWQAKTLRLQYEKRAGELIETKEATKSIRELVGCLSRLVHGSPGKTAAGLVAHLELDAAAMLKIKAYLEAEADDAYERLIVDVRRTLGALVNNADLGLDARDGNRGGPADQAAAG